MQVISDPMVRRTPLPTKLQRLAGAAPFAHHPPLQPALAAAGRFVEALLKISPAGARRLGMSAPEAWAVIAGGSDGPIMGLAWMAGNTAEVIPMPGELESLAGTRLVDAVRSSARQRQLTSMTLGISISPERVPALRFVNARKVVERDGHWMLSLDLTTTQGG